MNESFLETSFPLKAKSYCATCKEVFVVSLVYIKEEEVDENGKLDHVLCGLEQNLKHFCTKSLTFGRKGLGETFIFNCAEYTDYDDEPGRQSGHATAKWRLCRDS